MKRDDASGLSKLVEDRPHEARHPGPSSTCSDGPAAVVQPTVLILGAGGFLGRNTVQAFLDAGLVPRCGRRARGNVLGLRGLGCPLVVTDFAAPLTLRSAFAGVD
ncbi:MAG TPA: hypothetical protein VGE37_13370, partial [Archangium sp.]